MQWMLLPYRRYFDFRGRSRRKEFWMYQLFNLIVMAVCYTMVLAGGGLAMMTGSLAVADGTVGPQLTQPSTGPLFWAGFALLMIYGLGSIIPSLALTVRRLHDRNMSGWYLVGFIVAAIILSLIPVLGAIVVFALEIGWIVLMALPGTPGPNKYGPDPLDPSQAEVFA